MQGKIAVEEHFAIAETAAKSVRHPESGYWAGIHGKLIDLFDRRLAEMDAAGIACEVLSLNANGIQEIPEPANAVELARTANDALAAAVAKRPDRFAALAALPMQDPQAAAAELQRCVRDLKFKGALGQRLFPSRRGRHRGLLRPAAIPAVLGRGRAAWRAVLSASALYAAEPPPAL